MSLRKTALHDDGTSAFGLRISRPSDKGKIGNAAMNVFSSVVGRLIQQTVNNGLVLSYSRS